MAFLAGQILTAAALNSAVPLGETQSVTNAVFGSTASTTYTNTLAGSGTVTLAYVAPASGSIAVTFSATISPQASTRYGIVSIALSGAAGTVAASDDWQAFVKHSDSIVPDITVGRTKIFTGLVPGAAGTITMMHKVLVGSTNFSDRQVAWRPIGA